MKPRHATETWLWAAFLAALVLLGAVTYVGYRTVVRFEREMAGRARSEAALRALRELAAHLEEAESAVRGFLLTGDERHLELYFAAVQEIELHRSQLEDVADESAGRFLRELNPLIPERIAQLEEKIALQRAGTLDAGPLGAQLERGRVLMDRMHQITLGIERRGLRLAEERTARFEAWSRQARTVFLALGVFGSIVLAVVGLALWRVLRGQERARAELLRAQELIHAVIEGTTDAVFVKDREGCYMLINRAATEMLGSTREAVLGRDDRALFAADDARRIMESDREIMDGGVTRTKEEVATLLGAVRVFLSTKGPVRDEDGGVIGIFGISRDITERKHEEEERERILAELQTALAEVRTLRGLLPICANCKKVRDDAGLWHQIESYVRERSEAEFSHGLCPECARKLYGDLADG